MNTSYYAAFVRRFWFLSVFLCLFAFVAPTNAGSSSVGRVRQAFFFRPSGKSVDELKNNSDVLIFSLQDAQAAKKLKDSGYTRSIQVYFLAGELEGPEGATSSGAACTPKTAPWRNNLAYDSGIFCSEVHPNEDWFLHNGKGQRLYGTQGGYGGTHYFYFMNIGNKDFQNWMAARIAKTLKGDASVFDGVFLDNVELSMEKVVGELKLSDGTTKEYADDAAYRAAWISYLKVFSAQVRPAKSLWGNMIADRYDGSAWDPYLDYMDGGLAEAFAAGWPGSRFSASRWERNLEQLSKALARGKSVVGVTQGDSGSNALMNFGLASYLLIAEGDRAYYRYSQYADYGNWYQNDTFKVDLGNPLGARYKQADGTWRRDFEQGYVVVNPKTRAALIQQEDAPEPVDVIKQPTVAKSMVYFPLLTGQPGASQANAAPADTENVPAIWDDESGLGYLAGGE